MKYLKRPGFWMLVMLLALGASLMIGVGNARAERPVQQFIPVGKTSHMIKPYYRHQLIAPSFVIKPKNINYCPPDTTEFQCPTDYGQTLRERVPISKRRDLPDSGSLSRRGVAAKQRRVE